MSKCENCIHYDVCIKNGYASPKIKNCSCFKDESLFGEVAEITSITANKIIDEVERIIKYNTYPHLDMDGKLHKIWNALLGEEMLEKLKERYRNDKNK